MIGKQDTYFVRHHSDSPYKYMYSEADIKIKDMLGSLVDNIYVSLETRSSNNPLAFLWALTVLFYWQIYCYIHMR
jgi:hypothetical protein